MEYTGFIALAALLIAINELREWRSNEKHKAALHEFNCLNESMLEVEEAVSTLRLKIMESRESLAAQMGMTSDLQLLVKEGIQATESSQEFIKKASVDLATIVNEYKINGIPFGYERRKNIDSYDLVEGL